MLDASVASEECEECETPVIKVHLREFWPAESPRNCLQRAAQTGEQVCQAIILSYTSKCNPTTQAAARDEI